ncbi:hypothetical protein M2651_03935 [Clostridium sp. SYSU_GA19001]|uniref:germination lipoprotein GerS-related protein n=1 Tax=Clostridium caldaquaticum TaxID=2940653 RepID=UPI0020770870|nr:germination lipoprotein GerS-related protein [Clostridium caldaquaticum]MCM8710177.1 hypothetical protein [Clostridium caldaquaticum]
MRRKLLILFSVIFVFTIIVIFYGCGKSKKDPNEVTNYLKDLKTYSTDFIIEIKNDKQVITYEGKHYYSKALGHRMELGQDRVFIYKGDKIYAHDVKNNVRYTVDKKFDSGFLLSFVEEYINLLYTNEEIKYEFKENEMKKYQLIHLLIPGLNKDTEKAVMYVELTSNLPEKVIIYDEKDNEKVKITYKNFQPNPELKQELFKVE